jgi:hypothetical protein
MTSLGLDSDSDGRKSSVKKCRSLRLLESNIFVAVVEVDSILVDTLSFRNEYHHDSCRKFNDCDDEGIVWLLSMNEV